MYEGEIFTFSPVSLDLLVQALDELPEVPRHSLLGETGLGVAPGAIAGEE